MSRPTRPPIPESNADSGALDRREVMTLLFTDLVGSTRLKEDLGNVHALRLIQEHHAHVRALLREYPDGLEISTAGDSFFLAFRKPSDAVSFALRLQARLQQWNQKNDRKLLDRIGIHSGEVTVEPDVTGAVRDLHGLEVDKCARVMSLAGANRVLLTRFAFDNARASLKGQSIPEVGSIQWASHGMYRLKGVADPIEICEVADTALTPLEPPEDSEKARRLDSETEAAPEETPATGWKIWLAGARISRRMALRGAALTAILGMAVLVLEHFFPLLTELSYDLAYLLRPPQRPTEAVIVQMDSQSEEELRQPSDRGWDRRIHAALIRKLAEAGARAIVLDIWFAEPTTPEEDTPLIEAIRDFGKVVVAGRLIEDKRPGVFAQVTARGPFPELAEVAAWGLSHYPVRLDRIVRRPYRGTHDRDHLAVATVRLLGGQPPAGSDVWLNYYGPPGTIQSFSYAQVLSNHVPADAFADRVVFVGAVNINNPGFTEGWLNDQGATPYTRWFGRLSSGVEIVVTTVLNLLRREWLRRLSPWAELAMVLVSGLAAGWILARLRPIPALATGAAAAILIALIGMSSVWWTHIWTPWLVIVATQVPVAVGWSALAWAEAGGRSRAVRRVVGRAEQARA